MREDITTGKRSLLEFMVIRAKVEKDPEGFIRRLSRNLRVKLNEPDPDSDGNCKIWTGKRLPKGYGTINLRFEGRHHTIAVHRLFLILMLKHPIPPGYAAGHYYCHDERCVVHLQLEETGDNAKDSNQRRAAKRRAVA